MLHLNTRYGYLGNQSFRQHNSKHMSTYHISSLVLYLFYQRTNFLLLILLRQRKLDDEDKKYDFNAWDDVELPIDHIQKAHEKLKQDELSIKDTECTDLHDHWNSFYKKNNKNFFKDRKWIVKEFPLLDCENKTILELGCGVGNSLKHINKNNLLIGLDFSETAIRMLEHEGIVCDITQYIPFVNIDYVLSIFCLSAIEPKYHEKIFKNLYNVTKKGGKVFFRDYGYMDMVQLRYRNEQCIGENFYRRSDGTLTYFFKTDKLKQMAESAGFVVESLFEDKRMLTNRKKKIEMYRVMIQGVFVKV